MLSESAQEFCFLLVREGDKEGGAADAMGDGGEVELFLGNGEEADALADEGVPSGCGAVLAAAVDESAVEYEDVSFLEGGVLEERFKEGFYFWIVYVDV